MMFDFLFLHNVAQKSAAVVAASFAAAFGFIPHLFSLSGGFIAQPNVVVITPPQPILILPVSPELQRPAGFAERGEGEPAPTSTELIRQTSTSTTTVSSSSSSNSQKTKKTEPKPPLVPEIFTAKMILDRTGFSVNQRMDGAYRLLLHTTTTANSGFDWDLSAANIGGTAQIPKFDVSFSCDPPSDAPPADSPDQNPIFDVNASYRCAISLTDALLRKESKEIAFQAGAGRLVVKTSNLNTILKFNKNTNGFVFDNQSIAPVTVTGLTFDVSFTALNTSSPIVLRFVEPENESTLAEYPLQDLPADPSRPHTKKSIDVKASFSFTVRPRSQRLLIAQVLGVQPLAIIGINPEVTVALRQVSIDRSDIPATLLSPVVSWSCIPYDPSRAAQGLPTEQNCK